MTVLADFLMLGLSESLSNVPGLFTLVDKPHKFFTRKAARVQAELIGRGFAGEQQPSLPPPAPAIGREKSFEAELDKEAGRIVLSEYGPAWVIVNDAVQVIVMIGRQTIMVDIVEMLYGKALDVNRVLTGSDRSPNSDALRKILAHVSPGVAQTVLL